MSCNDNSRPFITSKPPIKGCEKKVYYYDNITPGVIERIWSAISANTAPHGNASDIFTGASTNIGGGSDISLPAHVAGMNTSAVANIETGWNVDTNNDPSNGTDQYQYASYIFIDNNGTQLRDVNTNTGERFRIWVGECCQNPSIVYERTTDTVSGDTGSAGTFVTLNRGWHLLAFQGSDSSAFGGVQLQESTNGTIWSNFAGETSLTKPALICKTESCDYELQLGETDCLPSCSSIGIIAKNPIETPPPTPAPIVEICTGPFKVSTGRTGWVQGWTAPTTANVPVTTGAWLPISTAITSPSCVTDMNVHVDFGVLYYQLRRMQMRQWVNWRLLVNGVAVVTETFDEYNYISQREDTNPDVIRPLDVRSRPMGFSSATRNNVPAGATIQVEVQYRYQFLSAQTSAYGRLIQGLRSQATFDFSPRNIVTNVT